MATAHEPAKALLPYLQRADELQTREPMVAYYCRLYAMDRGLKIPQKERTAYTNSLLSSLIKQLEKDKKSLNLGPEDNLHLEEFALNVFAKADKQDRAGRADINTAKTFYAASIFFEILYQFGPLQPELEQKQKYAVWKAADIRKALKEGRKPVPGPPAGDEDQSELDLGNETSISNPSREANSSDQIQDGADQRPFNMPTSPPQHPSSSYPSLNFQQPPPITRSESSLHSASYQQQPYLQETQQQPYLQETQQQPYLQETQQQPYLQETQQQPYLQETQQHLPQNYHSETQPPQLHSYPSGQFQQMPHNYPSEPQSQLHTQQHYPSHETSNYSYTHFQSYPSFSESSLPSVPSQYPSYYQGSDASYTSQTVQPATTYAATTQHLAASGNGVISETAAAPIQQQYTYDSNYQPPPEKIGEAHKAARFAVGALAFDEVSVAVEHLQKALELLTNPAAGQSSR